MSDPRRRGDPTAGIPGRRLFVAVALPDAATAAVAAVVDEVRAAGLPPDTHDVRWVRMDGLHLTLRFLGPTLDERIPPTERAVERAAAAGAPIDVELGGSGTFPLGGRPRALWIGITAGAEALGALARTVDEALVDAGWPPDPRPFRAHLTLARSDGLRAGPLVGGRLAAAMTDRHIAFRVERLGLYESLTGGGPARYLPIRVDPLGTPSV